MASQVAERVTIRDVARLAGVSIATVSRVFNGRTDVAPETRDTVLEVARTHGYVGRRPRANRAGLVGVTLPNVRSPYFAYLVSGVVEALSEHDLRAILCPTLHEHDREVGLLERLLHGTTDGAVLVLPAESSDELLALQRQGLPFVVLDPREPPAAGIPCVAAANASGAREATRHLLELGHRRIAAVTGPSGWNATVERLAGYHAALAGAGVAPDPRLEFEGDFLVAGGETAGGRLLDLPERPTAILAFNDELAVGTVAAATARGIRVPEELSVVGFDDSDFAAMVTPPLTTVRQPLAEMGRVAVTLLARLIDRSPLEALRVEISTTLVVRGSTAPPR